MSFNVSAVTGYVQVNEKQLLAKSILKAKTASLVSFQAGVKGTAQINLLNGDATIQSGAACGWNAAGSTVLTKRNIVTGLFKVNEAFCEKDLIGTFAEWGVKVAVGKTALPFESYFTDYKVASINKQVESLIWNGNLTGATSTYLDYADGLVKIIAAEGTVVDATNTGSTLLLAPLTAINLIVAKIPNEIIDSPELAILTGYDVVRAYIAAYNASNQFAGILMLDGATMTVTVPGTNVKLIGVPGLIGKNKAYALELSNIVIGGDLEGDESKYEFFYAQEAREYRFVAEWNFGVQISQPAMVVKYTV